MIDTAKHLEWRGWVADHAPKLLLFARQKARSEADAQDLVQEAVVESWQRQPGGAPPPLPAVFATIHRRAIDLGRSLDRRAVREQATAEPDSPVWFDRSPEEREAGRLLQSALEQLPEAQREVVTLKVWGGLTFAEIATLLELPLNTAASRYRNGLDALRRTMKEVLV